ncbi:MAG: bifunctional DNA-formamidopyrimidine glycosylase/DNA-(apurinic or apyrimidinic site) lyase [Gammaproteobacteria bacterium]|nr:bifunctional DNA-formamidopyrimidine glycosylase/DNA-(apurinic or apyrimidinic site) lyase [Gammaproteobacteria bacterium]MDH3561742.1 bifunctional DNA-formamidopyrimidine glycosylase/DNA-(apurinic or apyrimidinic site) lyase [Gammaproteobacteria bacterium]
MPELPEVETTRRGIAPHITNRTVTKVTVRDPRLRWPVPKRLPQMLEGMKITQVGRRGKYLLLETANGTAILHLGMSGSLRIVDRTIPVGKHDHIDIVFDKDRILRLTDPRRFGAVLWTRRPPHQHKLLRDLGPEPLGAAFTGAYLHALARGRKVAIKNFIMNSHIVAGIGNIYANEALYMAGIHPQRAAGRISNKKYTLLTEVIREVLNDSIARGGTTLRDFVNSDGKQGYFSLDLNVYAKGGEPCISCRTLIREIRQGQRATFYCPKCQR